MTGADFPDKFVLAYINHVAGVPFIQDGKVFSIGTEAGSVSYFLVGREAALNTVGAAVFIGIQSLIQGVKGFGNISIRPGYCGKGCLNGLSAQSPVQKIFHTVIGADILFDLYLMLFFLHVFSLCVGNDSKGAEGKGDDKACTCSGRNPSYQVFLVSLFQGIIRCF